MGTRSCGPAPRSSSTRVRGGMRASGMCPGLRLRPYLELWNLVFMQFERFADGTVRPLPKPSIDTGMGLERITAIAQGVASNYDTDLFARLLKAIGEMAGKRYDPASAEGVSFRVISDHARAATFLISDGVLPSNEGRGYVLRRILRRACGTARNWGSTNPSSSG